MTHNDIPAELFRELEHILGGFMNKYIAISMWVSVALSTSNLSAQEVVSAPSATIINNSTENVVRAGTPIPLRMMEGLTTKGKNLKIGYRFNLETVEPIIINVQTVIPAGSPAIGEVTDVRNKGMWGKSGRINARVLYVRVQGRQIRLTGQFDDKGVTGTVGVVAAVAFIPIAGFFTTGTSAKIDLGANISAFLDEDITIAAPAP